MTRKLLMKFLSWPLFFVAILALAVLACASGGPYVEEFNTAGSWGTGDDADVTGNVNNGRFEILVKATQGIYWSTGGEDFGDGTYEVEATQLEGTTDNGYGMLIRSNDNDDFYLFEVSGDGFIWIGLCKSGCEDDVVLLVNDNWFASDTVNQGLNATNRLRIQAEGGNLIFFVNDQEVGRATDTTLISGDIGILVETLGEGGVKVGFDNFKFTPLEK